MAKGHRSQIKRERNAQKDTRPSAKLSYARMSVQKACFVLDAIRGKDVKTALAIVMYNPRYASGKNSPISSFFLLSSLFQCKGEYPGKGSPLHESICCTQKVYEFCLCFCSYGMVFSIRQAECL